MTDQQAPELIWITGTSKCGAWNVKPNPNPSLQEHEKSYVRADLLEAAEKRIKELEEVLRCERLLVLDLKADLEIVNHDKAKAEAERDQALASVGAVSNEIKQEPLGAMISVERIRRALAAQKGE